MEGILRWLKPEEDFLEPIQVGLEGEERRWKAEVFGLKPPELGFDGTASFSFAAGKGREALVWDDSVGKKRMAQPVVSQDGE